MFGFLEIKILKQIIFLINLIIMIGKQHMTFLGSSIPFEDLIPLTYLLMFIIPNYAHLIGCFGFQNVKVLALFLRIGRMRTISLFLLFVRSSTFWTMLFGKNMMFREYVVDVLNFAPNQKLFNIVLILNHFIVKNILHSEYWL